MNERKFFAESEGLNDFMCVFLFAQNSGRKVGIVEGLGNFSSVLDSFFLFAQSRRGNVPGVDGARMQCAKRVELLTGP